MLMKWVLHIIIKSLKGQNLKNTRRKFWTFSSESFQWNHLFPIVELLNQNRGKKFPNCVNHLISSFSLPSVTGFLSTASQFKIKFQYHSNIPRWLWFVHPQRLINKSLETNKARQSLIPVWSERISRDDWKVKLSTVKAFSKKTHEGNFLVD